MRGNSWQYCSVQRFNIGEVQRNHRGWCLLCVCVVYMRNRTFVPIRPLSVRLLQIDALIAGHNFLCRWSCLTPLLPLASPTFPIIPHTGDVGQEAGHPEEKTATLLNHAALNDAPPQPPAEEKITTEAEHAGLMKQWLACEKAAWVHTLWPKWCSLMAKGRDDSNGRQTV